MNGDMLTGCLIQYLDEQAEVDEHFKSVYKRDRSDLLVKYIMEQAKKALDGKAGVLIDGVVFKWARDYYNDGIILEDLKKEEEKKAEEKKRVEHRAVSACKSEVVSAPKEEKKEMQLSMF